MHLRLGLQKRITLYVALGLAAMFMAVYWLGSRSINRATELAFEERLAIAESVASELSQELDHAINDAVEEAEKTATDRDASDIASQAFRHLSGTDAFMFFRVTGITLVPKGAAPVYAGQDGSTARPERNFPEISPGESSGMRISWGGGADGSGFASLSAPFHDEAGAVRGRVVVDTESVNSSEPFVPFGLSSPAADGDGTRPEPPRLAQYHLEVVAPDGTTVLSMGADHPLGTRSDHFDVIAPLVAAGTEGVLRHPGSSKTRDREHVMAAVPVPKSDLYMILFQDKDVALALPNEFRRSLALYGSIGFVIALVVAWLTTRHVVHPTEQLTGAARRMAAGDLDSPVVVRAPDEIGELADSIETMRRQLASAVSDRDHANRELGRRVQERTGQLRTALRQVISAQEGERQRLARDLHDDVAQQLVILTREIDRLRRDRPADSQEAEQADRVGEIARNTLGTVRRFSRNLRPSVLDDLGLVPALNWVASQARERAGLDILVECDADLQDLDPDVALTLFRVAQEAVYNIERHAGASHAEMRVERDDGVVQLTVSDDGQGFDLSTREEQPRNGHLGLLGMTERAELMGGSLQIDSRQGDGTAVIITIPMTGPCDDHAAPTAPPGAIVAASNAPPGPPARAAAPTRPLPSGS